MRPIERIEEKHRRMYEDIDRDGFSWTRGEYTYNWDDSEYCREEERQREAEEERRREEEWRWDSSSDDWF